MGQVIVKTQDRKLIKFEMNPLEERNHTNKNPTE